MPDDKRTNDSSGGFDDWLDEEPGPDSDPYSQLSADDPEAEIADWMAFTQGDEQSGVADGEGTDGEPESPDQAAEDVSEAAVADESADDEPTAEIEVEAADTSPLTQDVEAVEETEYVDFDEDEETAEIPVVGADSDDTVDDAVDMSDPDPRTTVEVSDWDGGGRADTDEVPIIAGADIVDATVVNETDTSKTLDDPDALVAIPAIVMDDAEHPDDGADDVSDDGPPDDTADSATSDQAGDLDADTGELDPVPSATSAASDVFGASGGGESDDQDDDTGELEIASIAGAGAVAATASTSSGFGDLWDQDADGNDVTSSDPADTSDEFDMSQGDYLQTATKEHAGLAAAIAEAETEDTEQVALAAPIPGLESTVVGFDDVVEAEGHRKARARGSGNLVARVVTAVVLIAALGASLVWRPALLGLATAVFVIGAGEFYTALTRTGRHPIAAFGFAGIIAASVGAYVSGAVAITTAMVLVTTILLLYYAVVPGRRDPVGNLGLTITVMVWVSLGAYAMLIVVSDDWRPLVLGTVVVVAAMDIAQYFVGRAIGRHQLAPWVSPKKTVEGLIGGVIVALTIGALLHFVEPFELTSGLVLGVAVAVLAPMGDLAMSAAKRALDLKDMGSVLPGHGGFLDRIDGLLFVIPAAWVIFLWAGLL